MIFGLEETMKGFDRVADAVQKAGANTVAETARFVVTEAQARAPRDTGALHDSLNFELSDNGMTADVGPEKGVTRIDDQGKIRDPQVYAHMIEMGSVNHPARPFLRPALDAAAHPFETKVAESVGKVIEDAAS